LTLAAWSWVNGDWRWLRRRDQVLAGVITFGLLVGWTLLLSRFAGTEQVGKTAGIELFSRLVPYRVADFVSMVFFAPILFVVTLPASLFLIPMVRERFAALTASAAKSTGWKLRPRAMVQSLGMTPFESFCWCWLIANGLFLAIAPAKAPRYSLPVFPAVFLLAASWIERRMHGYQPADFTLTRIWRAVFACVLGIAAIAILAMTLVAVRWEKLPAIALEAGPGIFALIAMGTLAAGWWGLRAVRTGNYREVVIACMLIALAAQGPAWAIWWPLRAAADSRAAHVARIEQHLLPGEPVLVLGRKDYMEMAYYSPRDFYRLRSPASARDRWSGARVHFLLPKPDAAKLLPDGGREFTTVAEFNEQGTPAILVEGAAQSIPAS
jgi:hypothetical protein